MRIDELAKTLEPKVLRAFFDAINEITSQAELGRIADRLERGDVQGVFEALHLDPAAYRGLERVLEDTYAAGGLATVGGFPLLKSGSGGRVVVRFDVRNLRAESWLRNHSSTLITRIMEDQRAAIRAALASALGAGTNPRTAALDLVGRVNRITGRREGGLLGLTSSQERYVQTAREQLLSGDPVRLRDYLTRVRRDKRFDRTVLKAIAEGKPLPADTVSKMIGRYADSLLQLRGETIARTETLASLHAAQDEAFRQAVDTGAIAASDVRRAWHSAGDKRVRDTHAELNGESVGLNEPFVTSTGVQLMYPCDPAAPIEETANCRCYVENRIDFLANIR